MKRYFVLLVVAASVFFAIGLGWGVWTKNKQAENLAHSAPLRVLCAENWLSSETLEKFSFAEGVRIQLWTYSRPSEFLRQMANADGNVDVICTTSLLIKSLLHSHWLKKMDYQSLPNMKLLAVDFSHLPFDPANEYSVPVLWNLYGFVGKAEAPASTTWKQIWQSKKVSLWGEELNVLALMNRLGLNIEQRLQEEETSKSTKALEEDILRFKKTAVQFLKPGDGQFAAEDLTGKSDWSEAPLSRVARLLAENSEFKFWLPQDGATLEIGVFAIGEKSPRAEIAMKLINELISTNEALAIHERTGAGVVHASLSNLGSIPSLQKAEALRQFPLTRLQFPDLSLEALPRFEKIFDETVAAK